MTRRLQRVLALLPSAALGGAEAHTATLLRALADAGCDVAAAVAPALAPGFAASVPDVRPAGIGWDDSGGIGAAIARQQAAASPLLASFRPDLALLPLPWPTHSLGLLAALAAAGIPAVAIAHLAPTAPEPVAQAAAATTPRGRTLFGAVSAPVAGRLAEAFALTPGMVAVVPNGVPVPTPDPRAIAAGRLAKRVALGLPEGAPVVLAVGRLEPKKGADLLPPLAAGLHARLGGTLVALGEGPLGPVLAAHPAAAGTAPALRLLGQVGDVGAWMWAADALVLPSRLEGCPLVFLEAAARRLPVIASPAALEAWGDAAAMARLADPPTVAALAETLAGGAAVQHRVAAAHAMATAHDEPAMVAAWLGLMREAVA